MSSNDNEENINNAAALEFMQIMNPLFHKAAELGILDADTTEFTERFETFRSSFLVSDNIQLHAAAVRVINEWLSRTGQSVTDDDNLKLQLVQLVFSMLLDGRMNFLEKQYSSLLEELERKGMLVRREEGEEEK